MTEMMHPKAIERYLEQLKEVKQRGIVFQSFSSGRVTAIFEEATVEIATLQLRKILELLAFGFVLTIGEKAIPAYASFTKYENSDEFLHQLRKLNKDYYPQPILQERAENGEMYWNTPAKDTYLTPEDFCMFAPIEY